MLRRFSPGSSSPSSSSAAAAAAGGGVARVAAVASSALRSIVIPRQLKAYGDNFAPTHRQTQSYLVSHQELTEVAKLSNKARATSAAKPVATFEDMLLPSKVHAALDELGVAVPSPIQQSAIPVVMERETNSVIVASANGTGKTLAYLAPIFASMLKDRDVYNIPLRENRPRAIIFAPTQELIWQIHNICKVFCKHTGMTSVAFTSTRRNNRKWRQVMKKTMPDVMVVGPSLALRAIETRRLFLDDLRHVVLDEADELIAPSSTRLGSRFVNKVLRRMLYRHLWPASTQTLFVTSGITRDLAGYVKRRHGAAVPAVVGGELHLPSRSSRHRFVLLQKEAHKLDALRRVLIRGGWYPKRDEDVVVGGGSSEWDEAGAGTPSTATSSAGPEGKSSSLRGDDDSSSSSSSLGPEAERDIDDATRKMNDNSKNNFSTSKQIVLRWEYQSTHPAPFTNQFASQADAVGRERRVIIFFRKIDRCTAIFHKLRKNGFDVAILHAELPVEVRRANFRKWATASATEPRILCTTDVAARGIDVDVTSVINFDMPTQASSYLNRAGRCARMGRPGSVVSLHTAKERVIVSAVRQFVDKRVPLEGVHHWSVHMQKPSYSEFRTQRIQKLYKKYVSLITRSIVPAHLEKTYTKHVATWRPIWHPKTVGDHGGVPVNQQKKLTSRIMAHAIWHRRAKLASAKGGSAKFGRKGKEGTHATTPGVMGVMTVGGAEPQHFKAGRDQYSSHVVGPPSGPPK